MTDRMEAQLHQLLQEAANGVAEQPAENKGKTGAFYYSFMDEPTIDRIGAGADVREDVELDGRLQRRRELVAGKRRPNALERRFVVCHARVFIGPVTAFSTRVRGCASARGTRVRECVLPLS
mgnify:CR=1 FL=1